MSRPTIRTDRVRETFLKTLEATCNVSGSCRAAGIGRQSVYDWRDADAGFAQAWIEAEEAAADRLEQVAFERATAGESDRMLEILLKAHRPKYRDKQSIDLTASVTVDHAGEARNEIEDIFGQTPHLIEPIRG